MWPSPRRTRQLHLHLDARRHQPPQHAARVRRNAYRAFLAELAARGLTIMITEMDVLDEPAVKVFVTFGLSDRYTWLQEDGAPLW
jgi:GH35 family endo-1,4-beta-xylanase